MSLLNTYLLGAAEATGHASVHWVPSGLPRRYDNLGDLAPYSPIQLSNMHCTNLMSARYRQCTLSQDTFKKIQYIYWITSKQTAQTNTLLAKNQSLELCIVTSHCRNHMLEIRHQHKHWCWWLLYLSRKTSTQTYMQYVLTTRLDS